MDGMSIVKCYGYCSILGIRLISIFKMVRSNPFACRASFVTTVVTVVGFKLSSFQAWMAIGQVPNKWKALTWHGMAKCVLRKWVLWISHSQALDVYYSSAWGPKYHQKRCWNLSLHIASLFIFPEWFRIFDLVRGFGINYALYTVHPSMHAVTIP